MWIIDFFDEKGHQVENSGLTIICKDQLSAILFVMEIYDVFMTIRSRHNDWCVFAKEGFRAVMTRK